MKVFVRLHDCIHVHIHAYDVFVIGVVLSPSGFVYGAAVSKLIWRFVLLKTMAQLLMTESLGDLI